MKKKKVLSKAAKIKRFAPLQRWEDSQRAFWFFLGAVLMIVEYIVVKIMK